MGGDMGSVQEWARLHGIPLCRVCETPKDERDNLWWHGVCPKCQPVFRAAYAAMNDLILQHTRPGGSGCLLHDDMEAGRAGGCLSCDTMLRAAESPAETAAAPSAEEPSEEPPTHPRARQDPEDMEALADIEHEQWSGWMRYMLRTIEREDGAARRGGPSSYPDFMDALNRLPCVQRWRKQMATPYEELPEHSKASDREEVRTKLPAYRPSGFRAASS